MEILVEVVTGFGFGFGNFGRGERNGEVIDRSAERCVRAAAHEEAELSALGCFVVCLLGFVIEE